MDLYKSSLCWYDYMEVRDGYWRKAPLLGTALCIGCYSVVLVVVFYGRSGRLLFESRTIDAILTFYLCVCAYVRVCVCVCVCVRDCVWMHMCVSVGVSIFVCLGVCICMCVCVCVGIFDLV